MLNRGSRDVLYVQEPQKKFPSQTEAVEFILGKLNVSCKIYSLVVNGQSFFVIDGYLLNLFQLISQLSLENIKHKAEQ